VQFDQPKEMNLKDLSASKFQTMVTQYKLEFAGADSSGYMHSMGMLLGTQ
jgi:hypothetical protein